MLDFAYLDGPMAILRDRNYYLASNVIGITKAMGKIRESGSSDATAKYRLLVLANHLTRIQDVISRPDWF
mgnify:CR=1 FL=1